MYRSMKLLSSFVCSLPHGLQYAFGRLLGRIAWLFVPKKRKQLAIEQILFCQLAETVEEAKYIAKKSVTRFGPMIIDVLRFPEICDGSYRDMIEFEGLEYLIDIKESGKGAVIASAHSGNWELLGGVLASEGFPLISVAMKQDGDADRFINEYRAIMHQHVTYKTGVREMLKEMKAGGMIGLIMDQDPGKTGVLAPFFGYETLTATGPALMARMLDGPIVPVTIHFDKYKQKHIIQVHTPIYVEKTEDKDKDVLRTTILLNEIIEDHIRRYPTEWFWLHNRWKWTRRLHPDIDLPPEGLVLKGERHDA